MYFEQTHLPCQSNLRVITIEEYSERLIFLERELNYQIEFSVIAVAPFFGEVLPLGSKQGILCPAN